MPCDGLEFCPNWWRVEEAPCRIWVSFLTPDELTKKTAANIPRILIRSWDDELEATSFFQTGWAWDRTS